MTRRNGLNIKDPVDAIDTGRAHALDTDDLHLELHGPQWSMHQLLTQFGNDERAHRKHPNGPLLGPDGKFFQRESD